MSNLNNAAAEETKKPAAGHDSEELDEKELEGVAGGINPQPLPPAPMRRS